MNLNYTVTSDVLNDCIAQCGIRHVLTSRKFMEKMKFDLDAEVIYLEDFKEKPTLADKLVGASGGMGKGTVNCFWVSRKPPLKSPWR